MPDDSGAVVPEAVDLERASPAFRAFFHAHFVDTTVARRGEFDWALVRRLRSDELELARRLARANLDRGQIYLDAAGVLNDHRAIPVLHNLLDRSRNLSEQITIARPLWFLERSPKYPALIERLVHSKDATLKRQHIWEILLLADERALDHLFAMAEDHDPSVRELALYHLTILSRGWITRALISGDPRPRDFAYFRSRRGNPRFVRRLLRALKRDHEAHLLRPSTTRGLR